MFFSNIVLNFLIGMSFSLQPENAEEKYFKDTIFPIQIIELKSAEKSPTKSSAILVHLKIKKSKGTQILLSENNTLIQPRSSLIQLSNMSESEYKPNFDFVEEDLTITLVPTIFVAGVTTAKKEIPYTYYIKEGLGSKYYKIKVVMILEPTEDRDNNKVSVDQVLVEEKSDGPVIAYSESKIGPKLKNTLRKLNPGAEIALSVQVIFTKSLLTNENIRDLKEELLREGISIWKSDTGVFEVGEGRVSPEKIAHLLKYAQIVAIESQ